MPSGVTFLHHANAITLVPCEPALKQALESIISLELSEETAARLETEHIRLSRAANPSLPWDRFLQACLAIGLAKLREMSALEAFELLDRLEG